MSIYRDSLKESGDECRPDNQRLEQIIAGSLLCLLPLPNRSWLDVGAGQAKAEQRITGFGFTYMSQDPAPNQPVDVTIPFHTIRTHKFGVVSAFHVIEHVPCYVNFLKDMKGLVEAGGYAVVSTPLKVQTEYHYRAFAKGSHVLNSLIALGNLIASFDIHEDRFVRTDAMAGITDPKSILSIWKP